MSRDRGMDVANRSYIYGHNMLLGYLAYRIALFSHGIYVYIDYIYS